MFSVIAWPGCDDVMSVNTLPRPGFSTNACDSREIMYDVGSGHDRLDDPFTQNAPAGRPSMRALSIFAPVRIKSPSIPEISTVVVGCEMNDRTGARPLSTPFASNQSPPPRTHGERRARLANAWWA